MSELVSVCVPTYNGEKYLRESLDCIANQTYRSLEILVVDDCSSDATQAIVQQYIKQDDRFKLVINEENVGLVDNWNECLSLASGKWIKLHFQDDLMGTTAIEQMVSMAREHSVDLVLTDREFFYEDGITDQFAGLKRLSDIFQEKGIIDPDMALKYLEEWGIRDNFIGEPILGLINREVITKYGMYDNSLKQIVDFEYWLRICLNSKIGSIPDRIHQFRIHHDSQGAKNVRGQDDLTISDHDKMKLVHKLLTDPVYASFQQKASPSFKDELVRKHINELISLNGYQFMRNLVEPNLMNYLPIPSWLWVRANINGLLRKLGTSIRL